MSQKEQMLPVEILHDPEHLREFIAIREDRAIDGSLVGKIVAVGLIPDEVYGRLKEDQKGNQGAKYFFARPLMEGSSVRHHWTISRKEK